MTKVHQHGVFEAAVEHLGRGPGLELDDHRPPRAAPLGPSEFGDRIAGAVGRADLNGSGVDLHFIATGDINTYGVAVDAQHLYWANLRAGTIGRANLDGSSPDPGFISGASAPQLGHALLRALHQLQTVETHLVVSAGARYT